MALDQGFLVVGAAWYIDIRYRVASERIKYWVANVWKTCVSNGLGAGGIVNRVSSYVRENGSMAGQ